MDRARLGVVSWKDTKTYGKDMFTPGELDGLEPIMLTSAGWAKRKDNGDVIICVDYCPDSTDQRAMFRQCQVIPKECIVRIETVEVYCEPAANVQA